MFALAGMALILLLLAVRTRRQGLDPRKLLGSIHGDRDPDHLAQAADAFDEGGYHDTAEVLRDRANQVRAGKVKPGPSLLVSPLPGVPDASWTRFALGMATASPGSRSARGHLGMFRMGLPRLEDLGYLKQKKAEGTGAPVVEWQAPLSEKVFLLSPELQYQAFSESMVDHRKQILARHGGALGRVLAGRPATLSGLLGVAHQAGLAGLDTWIAAGGDRKRYPNTTAAYVRWVRLF